MEHRVEGGLWFPFPPVSGGSCPNLRGLYTKNKKEVIISVFFVMYNVFYSSRTKFEAIIVNVCVLYAKFSLDCFVVEHSFYFTSRVTFSRWTF